MDMEVLSVVAKQVMTIQAALAAGDRFFIFEGKNILLNRSLALFITMNPMYQFRNVLPSNLKALFRPVAMASERAMQSILPFPLTLSFKFLSPL